MDGRNEQTMDGTNDGKMVGWMDGMNEQKMDGWSKWWMGGKLWINGWKGMLGKLID